MLKIGDLVRIVKQPKDHLIRDLVGKRGYVEDMNDDYIVFHELRADGLGGCGGIPIDCIELANDDQELLGWKKVRDDRFEAARKESEERTARYEKLKQKYLKEAHNKTDVDWIAVLDIFDLALKFQDEWERTLGW